MYCYNCGKEIDDKAIICVGCGVPVTPIAQQDIQQTQTIPTVAPKQMSGWIIASIVLLGICILSNISLGLQAGMNFWYIIGTLLTVILPLIFIVVDYNKSGGRRENKDEEIKEKKKLKQEVKYKQAFSNKTTGLIIVGTMVVTFAIIIGILAICGTFF